MKVIIQNTAKKDLKKLSKEIISQILKKLNVIKNKPLRYIERLKDTHLWKLRIGDYRCILFIHTGREEVHVLKVGHRKKIYKKAI